jgi:hypothetical protein
LNLRASSITVLYCAFIFYAVYLIFKYAFDRGHVFGTVLLMAGFYLLSGLLVYYILYGRFGLEILNSRYVIIKHVFSWRKYSQTFLVMHSNYTVPSPTGSIEEGATMKKIIISVFWRLTFFLLAILAVITSCNIFHARKLEGKFSKSYSQYERGDLVFRQKQQDSLSSYWYFSTDSPLWFHPDSGLRAIGGKMLAQQSNIKRAEKDLQWRKAKSEKANASNSIVKRENDWLFLISVLSVLMVILAGLGYLAWRRIRK